MRDAFSQVSAPIRQLHELVSDHPDFEVLQSPTFSGYCFRYMPNSLADRREEPDVQRLLDEINQQIVAAIRRNGQVLVMTTRIRDRVAIWMRNCPPGTFPADIDAAFEAIARWGRLLNKKLTVPKRTTAEMEVELCLSESHSSPTEASAT